MAKKLITFRFDDTLPAAQKAATNVVESLITEISDETERAIRNVITSSIRDGVPVYDAARSIRPLIGLTSAQSQAVMKYRSSLIDSGLTLEKVNQKTDKYADDSLKSRADSIARTEVMDALQTGQDEAWAQAQDKGLLSDNATKEVILTDDACEECVAIAEEGPVPIDEDFSEDGPPFHPRCRCTTAISTP